VSGWNRPKVTIEIADQPTWFISDLHLGDGTPSDIFFGKDRHLMALLDRIDREGALLVVVGDAMDFHQAWSFTRILRAHQELLASMSRLSRHGRLIYIVGNHDSDISSYRDLLNFRVCDELIIGGRILVTHGYEYDPYIGADLQSSHAATKLHHLVERYLNTWIRVPLGEFYTLANRMSFWITHKIAVVTLIWQRLWQLIGVEGVAQAHFDHLEYWTRTQMGDPMCMFHPIMNRLQQDRFEVIIAGHAHLPCRIQRGDRTYVNTGSWTFASSHYATYDGQQLRVRDWITGREFGEDFYQPVISGAIDRKDFWKWWRENYMGWLRFREGEERQVRRGWESYVRDYQHLARLDPLSAHAVLAVPEAAEPETSTPTLDPRHADGVPPLPRSETS
jgi:UDP-2,3-diacylglucosamine pyrophosphatase LpxH